MEQTILRSEVYALINSGEPFDMVFVTCHRKKGTGGDLYVCNGWMALHAREINNTAKRDSPADPDTSGDDLNERLSKDPNHGENGTVNVFNPANPGYHPVCVHYDLIQFFNGKRVIN